jgi:hypothetical protein
MCVYGDVCIGGMCLCVCVYMHADMYVYGAMDGVCTLCVHAWDKYSLQHVCVQDYHEVECVCPWLCTHLT